MKIKRFEFNMFPVNCYVLYDETGEAVVIDAGCYYSQEGQALKDFVADNGLRIVRLLNTHLHPDHIYGNAFMLKQFGLKAYAHSAEEFLLKGAATLSRMFGVPMTEPMPELGGHIEDGDEVSFGKTRLEAILVPGHSPGGLCYYCADDGCLFSGDVLFQGSIGRADLPGGDYEQLIQHVHSRLLVLPDETMVYPGHGAATNIGWEKRYNPYL